MISVWEYIIAKLILAVRPFLAFDVATRRLRELTSSLNPSKIRIWKKERGEREEWRVNGSCESEGRKGKEKGKNIEKGIERDRRKILPHSWG